VEAITGLGRTLRGSIVVAGKDLTHATPRQRLHAGMAHVPEDRQKDALVLPMELADNLVLDMYADPPVRRSASRNLGAVKENAERRVREFDIRAPALSTIPSCRSRVATSKKVVSRASSAGRSNWSWRRSRPAGSTSGRSIRPQEDRR